MDSNGDKCLCDDLKYEFIGVMELLRSFAVLVSETFISPKQQVQQ